MRRLLPLAVTVAVLGVILARVDRAALWANLKATRPAPFAWALVLFVPQNFISALRWKMMAGRFITIGWRDAVGMILGSQSLNIILPSKMGDLTKAVFLARSGALDLSRAGSLVIFEKALDLAALCLWAVLGAAGLFKFAPGRPDAPRLAALALLTATIGLAVIALVAVLYFLPPGRLSSLRRGAAAPSGGPHRLARLLASGREVMQTLQRAEARRGSLVTLSIILWGLHLLQIRCFFGSLNAETPWLAFASLTPLAIFVGLIPISLFGVGTRDAALIFLFTPYQPAEVMAGVGFYVSLRYIVPAIGGLPFLHYYLTLTRSAAADERPGAAGESQR